MSTFLTRLSELNERFADAAARISSWSLWLTLLTFGTLLWLLVEFFTGGRFDPGMSIWVAVLTIQTSIDSAAQRQAAMAMRRLDSKRDAHQDAQVNAIAELTVAIKEELDRSRERDEASAVRDDALRLLITKLLDMVSENEEPHG